MTDENYYYCEDSDQGDSKDVLSDSELHLAILENAHNSICMIPNLHKHALFLGWLERIAILAPKEIPRGRLVEIPINLRPSQMLN
ncbi:hypothetical protein TNCV_3311491 [Trichonephila clavipes]|nr:hypothetical protein TNCV_3311491 [Trichonephila clavipes]